MSCEEWDRLVRIKIEAVLEDNRAEIGMIIGPEDEAGRVVKRETEQALRVAIANLETHKQTHGC